MKEKLSWFDRIMTAVTFAEANEHETGKHFLTDTGPKFANKKKSKQCDAVLAADMHGAEVQS